MAYDILLYSFIPLIGYLGTYALYRYNIIKRSAHVQIWNLFILVAFLISGVFGFIVLIAMQYGIQLPGLKVFMMYWHAEFGIALFAITLVHIHSYWKSFSKVVIS